MACENEDVSHIIVLSGEGKKDVGQKNNTLFSGKYQHILENSS